MEGAAILLGLIFALAAAAVAWFRLWRPTSKPGQCGRCKYSTTGLTADRCPECGANAAARPPLKKRWLAVTALLTFLSLQFPWWSSRSQEPWYTCLIPTTLLCAIERLDPSDPEANNARGSMRFALMQSRQSNGMWGWQIALAIGDRLTDEAVESCLVTPQVWPEGEPIVVRVRWPDGLWKKNPQIPQWSDFGVAAESALTPGARAAVGVRARGVTGCNFGGGPYDLIVLPAQPVGSFDARFRLTSAVSRTTVIDREVTRRIHVAPRGTPVLEPIDSPALRKAFTDDVHIHLNTTFVCIQPPTWTLRAFPDVAMGTRVELLWKGEPIAEFRSPRTAGDEWQYIELPEEAKESEAVAERTRPAPKELTVRMTGDEYTALRQLSGTSYWAGSIELPLTEWVRLEAEALEAWKRAHP